MGKHTYINLLDRPYSLDKQAEGMAVSWAVMSGACDDCRHLPTCVENVDFIPPEETACMRKKAEILKQNGGAGHAAD